MAISLKAARVNAGFKQSEVAEITGVSREAICAYERGKRDITVTVFDKLCKLYGLSREDIFLPYNSTLSEKK